jgi:hypothetical protein
MQWTKERLEERLLAIRKDVETNGISARGRKEIIAFCNGEKNSAVGAIKAHCYECLGFYDSGGGSRDCENPVCPLYPFMPYSETRQKKPNYMTEDDRKKVGERLKASRLLRG